MPTQNFTRVPQEYHWKVLKDYRDRRSMELHEFLAYWDVSYEQLAIICECCKSTVGHWFVATEVSGRSPTRKHKQKLAEVHALWKRASESMLANTRN